MPPSAKRPPTCTGIMRRLWGCVAGASLGRELRLGGFMEITFANFDGLRVVCGIIINTKIDQVFLIQKISNLVDIKNFLVHVIFINYSL